MRLVSLGTKRRRLAALAIGAVGLAAAVVLPALPASAATACNVVYKIDNQWQGAFQGSVAITNTGDAWTSWTLRFTYANGQTITQLWNGQAAQSGANVTVTNMPWNNSVGTGATVTPGFLANWSGTNSIPTAFTVNGVACNGGTTPTTTAGGTTAVPTRTATASPTRTAGPTPSRTVTPTTGTVPTSGAPCSTNCPAHVDNPYSGATGYNNPEWRAKAAAESGGSRISSQPTGVWLDRIAAIAGTSSSSSNGSMGLAAHLDAALTQDAANGSAPLYAQFVIYDLPGRDCAALASNGELGATEIGRYQTEYIAPIAAIMSQSKYAALRIVAIIEIDSLPNLVTNTGGTAGATAACDTMKANGNYVTGIQYALNRLHAIPNVYTYIDAAHHGWLGWDTNFGPAADLFASTARGTTAGFASVDGFITNTANYSALTEPFVTINATVGGQSVRQSKWVDWNFYTDELTYATAFRNRLVSGGFNSNIGMLIDTSRNGWGGSQRPTAASTSTDMNTWVNASRIDRRIHAGNWCNQSGAGLGERPRSGPSSGIDAYVWIKPPGESDGSSSLIPNDEGKGFDRMCDPTYTGNGRNGNSMTGSLSGAPISGAWFSAQFQQLMANAYPAL